MIAGSSGPIAFDSRGARVPRSWGRRSLSIPLYLLLAATAIAALPLTAALGALVDLVRGGPWATLRCTLFLTFYLACEAVGIALSTALWLGRLVSASRRESYLRDNFRLQCWWGTTLFAGARRIFALRTEVEGDELVREGPFLLFARHTSVGDTLLPVVFVSAPHGIVLRYVLKVELLWDPCLDIVGHRLVNCFVQRGSTEGEREIGRVRGLVGGLGPNEGILIYPEGTRFTPAKRERAAARLAESSDPALAGLARRLTHVLPPRLGGALALLDANPGADVVFLAHAGFEGAGTFADLLAGRLVGQTIRVAFWRVPFRDIPRGRAAQSEWLLAEWQKLDGVVGRQHGLSSGSGPPP